MRDRGLQGTPNGQPRFHPFSRLVAAAIVRAMTRIRHILNGHGAHSGALLPVNLRGLLLLTLR